MKRIPKTKAAWRRIQPTSVKSALRLCKEYAREVKRLTIPAIAEYMSVTDDCLYKWMNGSMPADRIPAYEHICGIDYVTQYFGIRSNKIMIDIPVGKKASELEIAKLQKLSADALSLLVSHYQNDEESDLEKTTTALTQLLQGVAYHRENIQTQPELDLHGDEDE